MARYSKRYSKSGGAPRNKYVYGKKFKASKGKHKGKLVQYRYTGGRKSTKTMVRAKR